MSLPNLSQPSNTDMVASMSAPCSVDSSYKSVAGHQALQNNRHCMKKPSDTIQQVQQPAWDGSLKCAQYPALAQLAQRRVSPLM
jgi:hypothetical protein